ncbi:MAG TPA: potassium transporter KefB [Pontibacter sp.]
MTQHEVHNQQPVHPAPAGKRMLMGAAAGLLLISFFLIGATANPEWPTLWWIRPLLVVPAAGALGGLFFYNMDYLRSQGGWRTGLANFLSLIVFIVVLWLGTVLGLAGTMWD